MAKLSPQQRASLRCCASCEWIYTGADRYCPKCGFASYGARFVYGRKCYEYKYTQEPFIKQKIDRYEMLLLRKHKITNVPKRTSMIEVLKDGSDAR